MPGYAVHHRDSSTGKKEPIIYKKRLKNQIWWTTTVRPEYKRLKYYFELQTEEESWFYFEDGFVTRLMIYCVKFHMFPLSFLCLFPLNITISLLTIQCDVFYNIS